MGNYLDGISSTSSTGNSTPSGRDAQAPGPAPLGVADLVEQWVRSRPDALAVREPLTEVAHTYRELWERAGWVAAELHGSGVGHGDLVAVDLPRSADLIVALLGIVRAGAAYLPLDIQAPVERVTGIVGESGAAAVLAGPSGTRASGLDVPVLRVPDRRPAHAVPTVSANGEDRVYVTYTSGSTGRPKGVVIPHRAVVRLVTAPNYCVIEPGDRVAQTCNPAFDVTTSEVWGALCSGAVVVPFPALSGLDMNDWLALLEKEDITTMFLTTSLFHTVAWERPGAFGSLRDLVVGGEQLDLAAVRRVLAERPPARLVNGYGPTEGTSFATYFECTEESLAGLRRVPIGHALQQTSLYVLDETLRPTAPGEVGELCLGGPGVASEYLHRPELTAERFVTGPDGHRVYRTGDLVRELPSGALEMTGRRDRQVKLRGFRIELEEIEQTVVGTGLVDAAFVEKVGEGASARLVAFVLPGRSDAAPHEADDAGLRCSLAERLGADLPDYMLPSRWVVLTELPVGHTGKADRAAMLGALAQRDAAAAADRQETRTADPVYAAVCEALRTVLDGSDPAPDAGFVELGGNSLLAMRVAHLLKERLDRPVRPSDVLRAESPAALADLLRGRASAAV
ncbi:non-ribosomal peptide synthetase [Streptomyces sp. bgisy100]|uniref:non-ribosomal peptide synthetase n=1 Tax=Streptomyces sp. bgisy100 TaxID=3413783 RepID=UPI003D73C351